MLRINRSFCLKILMALIMFCLIYVVSGRFGEYEREVYKSEKKEFVVVIDPGHGGVDGGAVSVLSDVEKEINLSISLKLKEMLLEKGITVVMTREDDKGLYSENAKNKKSEDMKKRCEIVNSANADLMISVHQNNFSSEGVKGAQVFYFKGSKEGEDFAKILQEELIKGVDKENGRQAKENSTYYMLKNADCTSVIVECGFLSNYNEAALLRDEEYQKKIAKALSDGVEIYLKKIIKK